MLLAFAAYAAVVCVVAALRAESTSDFRDFWRTAGWFLETGEIRADLGVHNYLPAFTILMAPWCLLPLRAAAATFTLLSLAAFAGAVHLTERSLYRGRSGTPRPATLLAAGLMLPYVTSCAVLGALGLVLAFLVCACWHLAETRRESAAGLALALATVIKLLPGVLVGYFVLRRRWRLALAWALGFAVLAFGFPLAVQGPQRVREEYQAYIERAVVGHSAWTTIHAEKPVKANFSNNALPIVLRRLLSPVDARKGGPEQRLYVNLADLPRPMIWWIYAGCLAVILAVTVFATVRRPRRVGREGAPQPDTASSQTPGADSAAFGAWCCLMLLAAPLVWTHYLPMVYWALAVVCARLTERDRRRAAGAFALTVWGLGIVLMAWPAARAAGAQIASVLVVWLAATLFALRASRTAPA